jgi:hypothetical protein
MSAGGVEGVEGVERPRDPAGEIERLSPYEASQLDRVQFRRYLQALEAETALRRGEPPPSALGRLFKPAETERKLVLFSLGIIVILILVIVFVIEMWGDGSTAVTTPLITVAGTGLGFIGGMVADRKAGTPRPEGPDADSSQRRRTDPTGGDARPADGQAT